MRPYVLLACAVAGILGGGALISLVVLGACLIFCSLAVGAWAALFLIDVPERTVRAPAGVTSLPEFLQRKAVEPW